MAPDANTCSRSCRAWWRSSRACGGWQGVAQNQDGLRRAHTVSYLVEEGRRTLQALHRRRHTLPPRPEQAVSVGKLTARCTRTKQGGRRTRTCSLAVPQTGPRLSARSARPPQRWRAAQEPLCLGRQRWATATPQAAQPCGAGAQRYSPGSAPARRRSQPRAWLRVRFGQHSTRRERHNQRDGSALKARPCLAHNLVVGRRSKI